MDAEQSDPKLLKVAVDLILGNIDSLATCDFHVADLGEVRSEDVREIIEALGQDNKALVRVLARSVGEPLARTGDEVARMRAKVERESNRTSSEKGQVVSMVLAAQVAVFRWFAGEDENLVTATGLLKADEP